MKPEIGEPLRFGTPLSPSTSLVEIPMQSGIFKLGMVDLAKGLVLALLTAVLTSAQQAITAGNLDPASWDWRTIGGVALGAGVAYLLKNLLSTTDGKFAGMVGALLLCVVVSGCTLTGQGEQLLTDLGNRSLADIDTAHQLAFRNDNKAAMRCLEAKRQVVVLVKNMRIIGPETVLQAGLDITDPGGYLNQECLAWRQQIRDRAALYAGRTVALGAAFGF